MNSSQNFTTNNYNYEYVIKCYGDCFSKNINDYIYVPVKKNYDYIISNINYNFLLYPIIGSMVAYKAYGAKGLVIGFTAGVIDYFAIESGFPKPFLTLALCGALYLSPLKDYDIQFNSENGHAVQRSRSGTPCTLKNVENELSTTVSQSSEFDDVITPKPLYEKSFFVETPTPKAYGYQQNHMNNNAQKGKEKEDFYSFKSIYQEELKEDSKDNVSSLEGNVFDLYSRLNNFSFQKNHYKFAIDLIGALTGAFYPTINSNIPHHHIETIFSSLFTGLVLSKQSSQIINSLNFPEHTGLLKHLVENLDKYSILGNSFISSIECGIISLGFYKRYYVSTFLKLFSYTNTFFKGFSFLAQRSGLDKNFLPFLNNYINLNSVPNFLLTPFTLNIIFPSLISLSLMYGYENLGAYKPNYKFIYQNILDKFNNTLTVIIPDEREKNKLLDQVLITFIGIQLFSAHSTLSLIEKRTQINHFFSSVAAGAPNIQSLFTQAKKIPSSLLELTADIIKNNLDEMEKGNKFVELINNNPEYKSELSNFFLKLGKAITHNSEYEQKFKSLPIFEILFPFGAFIISNFFIYSQVKDFFVNKINNIFSGFYLEKLKNNNVNIYLKSKNLDSIIPHNIRDFIDQGIGHLSEILIFNINGGYSSVKLISLGAGTNYYFEFFNLAYNSLVGIFLGNTTYSSLQVELEDEKSKQDQLINYSVDLSIQIAALEERDFVSQALKVIQEKKISLEEKELLHTSSIHGLTAAYHQILSNIIVPYLGMSFFNQIDGIGYNIWNIMSLSGTVINLYPLTSNKMFQLYQFEKSYLIMNKLKSLITEAEAIIPFSSCEIKTIKSENDYFCISNFNFKIKNETKIFNEDFCFKSKKIAIHGKNGSGKTTFLVAIKSILDKIIFPDIEISGNITFYNKNGKAPKILISSPKNSNFISGRSLLEIITSNIYDESDKISKDSLALIKNILTRLEFNNFTNLKEEDVLKVLESKGDWNGLSDGEKEKIMLARIIYKSLLVNADIVCLDESWAHMDIETQPIAKELVDEFLVNKTVVIIEHSHKKYPSYALHIIKNQTFIESPNNQESSHLFHSQTSFLPSYNSTVEEKNECHNSELLGENNFNEVCLIN